MKRNYLRMLLTAMVSFAIISCEDSNSVDYSDDIIGKWALHTDNYIEMLNINSDGTVISNGCIDGQTWDYVPGNWVLSDDILQMTFQDPSKNFIGRIDVIAQGTLVLDPGTSGEVRKYHYTEIGLPESFKGIWVTKQDDYIEAISIESDGTIYATGQNRDLDEIWEDVKGECRVADHLLILEYPNDKRIIGYYKIVPGEVLEITDITTGKTLVYNYSKEDLSDEIVGIWYGVGENYTMMHKFNADGTIAGGIKQHSENAENGAGKWTTGNGKYELVGNLLVIKYPLYTIMTTITYHPETNIVVGELMDIEFYGKTIANRRFRDGLELEGTKWSYNSINVTDMSGKDKTIDIGGGIKYNPSSMDGSKIDEFGKSNLFELSFPSANTAKHQYTNINRKGQQVTTTTTAVLVPISVTNNRITFHMSQHPLSSLYNNLKDVEFMMFQDPKMKQMYLSMDKEDFITFTSNMYILQYAESEEDAAAKTEELSSAIDNMNLVITFNRSK